MIRTLFLSLLVLLAPTTLTWGQTKTLHDFVVQDITGKKYDLSQLKGKKVLIVNTASNCGLTHQYEALQKLYDQFGGENFTLLGFPANNFMNQEPGTNGEIQSFCTREYGVTFPMMSKISVKGKDQHPLYQWLTQKTLNGKMDSKVKWNFQKYLIDEKGQLVKVVPPKTKPLDEMIVNWIKGL